jgi:heat shock protein HtpX
LPPEVFTLVRKNRVRSALVAGALVFAGVPVGWAIEGWPWGPLVGLGVTCGLAGVTYFGGCWLVLKMIGVHRVTWQSDPELMAVVDEVRTRAGVRMPAVYIHDDTALNAFATGRNPRTAAVVVTAGLRGRLSRAQLAAVVAHEVAHVRCEDTRFALVMATMLGLIVFVADWARRVAFGAGRGVKHSTDAAKHGAAAAIVWGACFVVAAVLALVAPLLAWLMQVVISRKREYLADAAAVRLTGDPAALAGALSVMAQDKEPLVERANRATAHLFIVNPLERMRRVGQSWDSFMCSHPPLEKRIAALSAAGAAGGTGDGGHG